MEEGEADANKARGAIMSEAFEAAREEGRELLGEGKGEWFGLDGVRKGRSNKREAKAAIE